MSHFRVRRAKSGFTLIEILLVCAILALLAAMAFPNFMRSRIQANEAVAIHAVRSLSSVLENYRSSQVPPAYPNALADLSSSTPSYIDSVWTSGTRQGYQFTYTKVSDNQYTLVAVPLTINVTGIRSFFVDESGVLRSGTDSTGTPLE